MLARLRRFLAGLLLTGPTSACVDTESRHYIADYRVAEITQLPVHVTRRGALSQALWPTQNWPGDHGVESALPGDMLEVHYPVFDGHHPGVDAGPPPAWFLLRLSSDLVPVGELGQEENDDSAIWTTEPRVVNDWSRLSPCAPLTPGYDLLDPCFLGLGHRIHVPLAVLDEPWFPPSINLISRSPYLAGLLLWVQGVGDRSTESCLESLSKYPLSHPYDYEAWLKETGDGPFLHNDCQLRMLVLQGGSTWDFLQAQDALHNPGMPSGPKQLSSIIPETMRATAPALRPPQLSWTWNISGNGTKHLVPRGPAAVRDLTWPANSEILFCPQLSQFGRSRYAITLDAYPEAYVETHELLQALDAGIDIGPEQFLFETVEGYLPAVDFRSTAKKVWGYWEYDRGCLRIGIPAASDSFLLYTLVEPSAMGTIVEAFQIEVSP